MGDLFVVAGEQTVGDGPPTKLRRARVLWVFQEAAAMGFLLNGIVRQHTWNEAADGIDHDHRGQFATGQDVITNGDFVGDKMLAHPLINALVMSTEQGDTRLLRKFLGDVLVKQPPLRGEQDNRAALIDGLDGGKMARVS